MFLILLSGVFLLLRGIGRRRRVPAGVMSESPHDARRVPPPRPRGRGVGGAVHGARRGAADRAGRGARRDPGEAARAGARGARAVRGPAARPRRDRPAGHHALAVAGVVRVLPGQRVAAVDPGRARVGRAGRAGDDLVLEPGADGDRGARARLARRPARAPAALQDRRRPGRRRDPDERVGLHAPRARGRARAGHARRRAARPPGRLRLLAGALLGRARGARRRLPARAQARRGRRVRPAPGRAARGDRGRPRRRPAPRDRHERDRDHGHRRRRPDRRRGGHRDRARALASRRRRVGGLGDALRGAPAAAGGRRAGRQLHVQPAQVAVHELRLQRPVGRRPRPARSRRCRSSRRTCATRPRSPAR